MSIRLTLESVSAYRTVAANHSLETNCEKIKTSDFLESLVERKVKAFCCEKCSSMHEPNFAFPKYNCLQQYDYFAQRQQVWVNIKIALQVQAKQQFVWISFCFFV